jgi:hypothetical protein
MRLAGGTLAARGVRPAAAARPRTLPLVARPLVARAAVDEEAPLSAGDKERFDRIAQALVAKLEELPSDAEEDGAQPPAARRLAPPAPTAAACMPPALAAAPARGAWAAAEGPARPQRRRARMAAAPPPAAAPPATRGARHVACSRHARRASGRPPPQPRLRLPLHRR